MKAIQCKNSHVLSFHLNFFGYTLLSQLYIYKYNIYIIYIFHLHKNVHIGKNIIYTLYNVYTIYII